MFPHFYFRPPWSFFRSSWFDFIADSPWFYCSFVILIKLLFGVSYKYKACFSFSEGGIWKEINKKYRTWHPEPLGGAFLASVSLPRHRPRFRSLLRILSYIDHLYVVQSWRVRVTQLERTHKRCPRQSWWHQWQGTAYCCNLYTPFVLQLRVPWHIQQQTFDSVTKI